MNDRLLKLMKKCETPEAVVQEIQKFPGWYLISFEEKKMTRVELAREFYKQKGDK